MSAPVDVLAVMDAAAKEVAFSRTPDAAKPLREARAAVAELVANSRQALAALSQNAAFPADIALARHTLTAALAKFGGAVNRS